VNTSSRYVRLGRSMLLLLAGAVAVAFFSHQPAFAPVAADHGELKLSMAHLTERLEACQQLTPEELLALPPNMRNPQRCARARALAVLVIEVDGRELVHEQVRPAGLHRDGRAYLYRSWHLPAGQYTLRVQLRDSARDDGFDHDQSLSLTLVPGASVLLHIGDSEPTLSGMQVQHAASVNHNGGWR
jgi:hypothetical protein